MPNVLPVEFLLAMLDPENKAANKQLLVTQSPKASPRSEMQNGFFSSSKHGAIWQYVFAQAFLILFLYYFCGSWRQ